LQKPTSWASPVVGVLDSNSDPKGIDFPVPGNDDAIRAITTYCELIAGSVLDGIQAEVVSTGGDIGAADAPIAEVLPAAEAAAVVEAAPAAEAAPEAVAAPEAPKS